MAVKRKVLIAVGLLLAGWALVTAYFYWENQITVYNYQINESLQAGDARFIIRDITYTFYERKLYDFNPIKPPWYFKVVNKIPQPMQQPFFSLVSFYRMPLAKQEYPQVTVNGIFVAPKTAVALDNGFPDFAVELYNNNDELLTSSSGKRTDLDQDPLVVSFNSRGQSYSRDMSTQMKLVFYVNGIKLPDARVFTPQWVSKKYNALTFRPDRLDFYPTIDNEFITVMAAGDLKKAEEFIFAPVLDRFPWSNVKHQNWGNVKTLSAAYVGNYMGLRDVFCCQVLFNKVNQQQQIYLVDNNGKWEIIDISKLSEL